MFINRANGSLLLILGNAAWVAANYLRPAIKHPLIWNTVISDDANGRSSSCTLRACAPGDSAHRNVQWGHAAAVYEDGIE